MKTITKALTAAFAALTVVSCTEELTTTVYEPGTEIVFGASTSWLNNVETRTEYSGFDEDGDFISGSSVYERIDWVEGNDRIQILCAQAVDQDDDPNTSGTYQVGEPSPNGEKSEAAISLVSGSSSFFWGEGTHYFYALYPAAGTTSNHHNSVVSASDSSIESLTNKTAKITGAIPAEQYAIKVTVTDMDDNPDVDSYIYKPNMNLAYMYAAEKTDPVSSITLHFHPLVTAFEFSLKALDDAMASYDLVSLKLSSTSTDLTGGFTSTLSLDADEVATVDKASSGLGREITLNLPSGTRLSKDVFSVFTFLALGVEQTDLKLTLTFDGGGTRSLALNKKVDGGSAPITVGACKKAYFKLDVGTPEWVYHFGELDDLTFTYEGGSGDMASAFISYRTNGIVVEPVPFVVEYLAEGETEWSPTPPEWLVPGTMDLNGSIDGQPAAVTVDPKDKYTYNPHHLELVKAERVKEDFDLSRLNVATSGWVDPVLVERSTANCYVVQGPGSYKFPLVYGNGVVNGQINEYAFRSLKRVTEGSDELELDDGSVFRDHLDNQIYNNGNATSSPYIAVHLNKSGADFTAFLLWEDEEGLVEVNPVISGEGENAYLSFSVPAESITQGNALIGILVDGKIAWSWHIWVTEEDLTNTTEHNINTYGNLFHTEISPVNLGWCDGKEIDVYYERSCQVRATQATSGYSAAGVVTQTSHIVYYEGNNPYYQFGRKDPMVPAIADGVWKTTYPVENAYAIRTDRSDVYPGVAIQNPNIYYRFFSGSNNASNNWCKSTTNQYWNSSVYVNYRPETYGNDTWWVQSGLTTETLRTKTMYDPSPVGYAVPRKYEFITLSGFGYISDTSNIPQQHVGGTMGLWTCSPNWGYNSQNYTSYTTRNWSPVRRSYALPVRPIKE